MLMLQKRVASGLTIIFVASHFGILTKANAQSSPASITELSTALNRQVAINDAMRLELTSCQAEYADLVRAEETTQITLDKLMPEFREFQAGLDETTRKLHECNSEKAMLSQQLIIERESRKALEVLIDQIGDMLKPCGGDPGASLEDQVRHCFTFTPEPAPLIDTSDYENLVFQLSECAKIGSDSSEALGTCQKVRDDTQGALRICEENLDISTKLGLEISDQLDECKVRPVPISNEDRIVKFIGSSGPCDDFYLSLNEGVLEFSGTVSSTERMEEILVQLRRAYSDVVIDTSALQASGRCQRKIFGADIAIDMNEMGVSRRTQYQISNRETLILAENCGAVGQQLDSTPDKELPFERSALSVFWVLDASGRPVQCKRANGGWSIFRSPTSTTDHRPVVRRIE